MKALKFYKNYIDLNASRNSPENDIKHEASESYIFPCIFKLSL